MTSIQQPSTTPTSADQSHVDDQLRQAVLAKKEAQLQEWSAQIEKLQATVKQVGADVRSETEKKIDALIAARYQAGSRLEELRTAPRETWEDLLRQSDTTFQTVADQFHSFVRQHT